MNNKRKMKKKQQNTRAKWTGDVTQVVEHLLCKYGTLSSSPSPTKNQNSNNKKERLFSYIRVNKQREL
jgi:copper oxidase (laccase) domain-containing protein